MNRRTKRGYKLRIYLDALKDAKNTSDEQWLQNWITSGGQWMPRMAWIAYLEQCVIAETELYFSLEAA